MVTLTVNGVRCEIQSPADTPLLYVLRNELGLIGPQFGCGLAQCGACSVLVDGKETRSCITSVSDCANQEITTLEGLPARWAKQNGLSGDAAKNMLHPVQQAWIEQQTPQCGFCQSGITQDDWISYPILTLADLPEIEVVLLDNPKVGSYGGGPEAANALAAPAIAAALHDATGKVCRRLPLKPAYVQAALKA